jgi:hypothetical protein
MSVKEAQADQKREAIRKLYKSLTAQRLQQKEIKKQGKGLIKNISKVGNTVVNKISKVGKKVGKFAEKVLNPDAWMPLDVKNLMNTKGDQIITSITLRRNPVSHLITGAMNVVSLGKFQKQMDIQPYDELFHLAMLVETANTKFLLEKIERVNVSYSISSPEGLETLYVPLNGKKINVFDLINNTKLQMGKTNFLDYDAVRNNCQVFIMNILDANKLLNDGNLEWVKQNTEVLFKGNKTLAKISKKLTDIGASANVLFHGGDLNNYEKNNISKDNIMSDFQYLLPQKELQHKIQLSQLKDSTFPEPLMAGMGVGRTFKKLGSQIKSGVSKVEHVVDKADDIQKKINNIIDKMENIPNQAKSHLKMVGLDLAEILVKRGIPATAGTIAGMLATVATGNPALGVAASVSAGYGASLLANKLAKEEDISGSSGSGLYGGMGLYAGGQHGSGFGEKSDDEECSCSHCEMCGGRLFIDRKFSLRDVYDGAKSIPKQVNKNIKSLKQGKPKEKNMEGGRMGSDPVTYTPRGRGIPKQPDVIDNGVRGPSMGGRGVKGSQQAKDFMKKLRDMRKTK